jgi:hypothetical protein
MRSSTKKPGPKAVASATSTRKVSSPKNKQPASDQLI